MAKLDINLHGNIFVIFFDQLRKKVCIKHKSPFDDHQFYSVDMTITFFQSVWLSWVILFRAPAKVILPKSFTSKFMTNIWACFCLAFTASYTANLGKFSIRIDQKKILFSFLAAFMITKEVYFDLSGINDFRVSSTFG